MLLLLFVSNPVGAQENLQPEFVEEFPHFPGGDSLFAKYLQDSIRYPKYEKELRIQGTVYVYFEIAKTGAVENVQVKRGISHGPGLDAEAKRVIESMPDWTPGRINGRAIKVALTQPVHFTLPDLPDSSSSVHSADTIPASFPGGQAGQQKFISNNVRYPNIAKEQGHMGTVYIQYTVDTTGKVTDAKVFKGVEGAPELDEEALRVVKKFPKHEPARVNGKVQETFLIYPVRFVLQ